MRSRVKRLFCLCWTVKLLCAVLLLFVGDKPWGKHGHGSTEYVPPHEAG